MLLKSIHLTNFLSFGPNAKPIPLGPLNVVIGPNGSGKSNLLAAISLLPALPNNIAPTIREGGGIGAWLWQGDQRVFHARMAVTTGFPDKNPPDDKIDLQLTYEAQFENGGSYLSFTHEEVGALSSDSYFYDSELKRLQTFTDGKARDESYFKNFDVRQSILAQLKDPLRYPLFTIAGDLFSEIRLYRNWNFGPDTSVRQAQSADLPNDYLESDVSNFGLVLNKIRNDPSAKKLLIEALQKLYAGIDDFGVKIEANTVQVFLHEGGRTVPATRLSDGTLRYLCLLIILLHPDPPPLVCIEEPELGLHPDILPTLAELLKEASERMQLIVTTHSDVLVDAMTDCPETILIAEKDESGTSINRLDPEELKPWLEKYRLGDLWTRGQLGGTRW